MRCFAVMMLMVLAPVVAHGEDASKKKTFETFTVVRTEKGEVRLTDEQAGAMDDLNSRNIMFTEDEFIDVVKRGDIENVKSFLKAGMSPNTRDERSWPVIMIATSKGFADVVGALADAGALLGFKTDKGWTALHLAVLLSKNDTAKVLVEKGADIEALTNTGATPLLIAVEEKNLELTEFLLAKGADPRARTEFGATPLNVAVENGQADMLKVFEKAGLKKALAETRASISIERKEDAKREAEEERERRAATPKMRRPGEEIPDVAETETVSGKGKEAEEPKISEEKVKEALKDKKAGKGTKKPTEAGTAVKKAEMSATKMAVPPEVPSTPAPAPTKKKAAAKAPPAEEVEIQDMPPVPEEGGE